MTQPIMSPEDLKRVLSTAKLATHCRRVDEPLWRKIVSVDDVDGGGIWLADLFDPSAQSTGVFFANLLSDPSEILFCRMEEVPLVSKELTPAQMLFQKLSNLKQEMLTITKDISSVEQVNKEAYRNCLLNIHTTLRTASGVGGSKSIYYWCAEQGCSLATATVIVALCDEIYAHWMMLGQKTSSLLLKQSVYEEWHRRFKQIDLVLDDLKKASTA